MTKSFSSSHSYNSTRPKSCLSLNSSYTAESPSLSSSHVINSSRYFSRGPLWKMSLTVQRMRTVFGSIAGWGRERWKSLEHEISLRQATSFPLLFMSAKSCDWEWVTSQEEINLPLKTLCHYAECYGWVEWCGGTCGCGLRSLEATTAFHVEIGYGRWDHRCLLD